MDSSLWQYALICHNQRRFSWGSILAAWEITRVIQVISGRPTSTWSFLMLLSGGPKSYDGEILYLASYIYVVIIVNKAFFCLCKKGKKKKNHVWVWLWGFLNVMDLWIGEILWEIWKWMLSFYQPEYVDDPFYIKFMSVINTEDWIKVKCKLRFDTKLDLP